MVCFERMIVLKIKEKRRIEQQEQQGQLLREEILSEASVIIVRCIVIHFDSTL